MKDSSLHFETNMHIWQNEGHDEPCSFQISRYVCKTEQCVCDYNYDYTVLLKLHIITVLVEQLLGEKGVFFPLETQGLIRFLLCKRSDRLVNATLKYTQTFMY